MFFFCFCDKKLVLLVFFGKRILVPVFLVFWFFLQKQNDKTNIWAEEKLLGEDDSGGDKN